MTASLSKSRAQGRVPGLPRTLGGRLCLDFINTIDGRLGDAPVDALAGPEDLARWGYHVGALDRAQADALVAQGNRDPATAAAALERATTVREDAYALFSQLAVGNPPPAGPLAGVNSAVQATLGCARLDPVDPHGPQLGWKVGRELSLDRVTNLVTLDILALLTSPELTRVKRCPGCGDCGWLFLDTSRNGSRQWCSMEGCGSRAKMRRLYRRQRDPS